MGNFTPKGKIVDSEDLLLPPNFPRDISPPTSFTPDKSSPMNATRNGFQSNASRRKSSDMSRETNERPTHYVGNEKSHAIKDEESERRESGGGWSPKRKRPLWVREGATKRQSFECLPFRMMLQILVPIIFFTPRALADFGGRIGSFCQIDQDCTTQNSRCNHGTCACLPYYATYNNTQCLQSTLLGMPCVTSEQCWQKVANSSCAAGVCRCNKGFLQFRRHTCLSPAKVGEVCYSNTHCKMWDTESQCDYLIPKLFGRCSCRGRAKGDRCLPSSAPTPVRTKPRPQTSESLRRGEETEGPVSLGLACLTDRQCKASDPNSRCRGGVCDCVVGNGTCSAASVGCLKGTFQCRGSGKCISWYLVCDGRRDCPHGEDEQCRETCPRTAFRCARSRPHVCISAGLRCNGSPDCPAGEDEVNCRDIANRGCPRGTYRCKDGTCVGGHEFCNALLTCPDGSDEPEGACNARGPAHYCPFRCANGRCRSTAVACSGRDGCGDNSDETNCQICRCPKA